MDGKSFKDPQEKFSGAWLLDAAGGVEGIKENVRIENLVRSRVQALLSNAGLPEAGVAKEVLYWMPQEFVEWYGALFLQAVKLDGRGRQSDGREENVKGGVTGALKKKKGETAEEYNRRAAGRPDGGKIAVKTTGKKYKVAWTIKDEEAARLKGDLDKALVRIAMLGKGVGELQKFVRRTQGVIGKIVEREGGKNHGSRPGVFCEDCGKAMSGDWRRCPFHDA